MYKYASLILLLGYSLIASATTVTATITDSDSQTWNNGTYTISLINPRPDITPNVSGTALTSGQLNLTGSLSSGGALSVTLVDSTTISPIGTTWAFTICPNASSPCGTGTSTVHGSSQTLTTFLNSIISAPRFTAISGSYGYSDTEVAVVPSNGAMYYNVTMGVRVCALSGSTCTWSTLAGGSSYTPSAVAITGGSINGTTFDNGVIGGTTPAVITGTIITANTGFISATGAPSVNSGYLFPGGIGMSSFSNDLFFYVGSNVVEGFTGTTAILPNSYSLGWTSGTVTGATVDTGISRDAAGVLDIGNGSNADKSGTINAATINVNGGTHVVYICAGGTFSGLLATSSGACTGSTGTATHLSIN